MENSSIPNYTIVISPGEDDDVWLADVPALELTTQGFSQVHAAEMAKEAILLHTEGLLELGKPLPADIAHPFPEAG